MNKKSILLLGFGTVDLDVRKKCFKNIKINIQKMFCEYSVFMAFTSRFVVKKVREMGEDILDDEETIKNVCSNFDEVIIQPIFITDGDEVKRINDIIKPYENKTSIKIGKPLLYDEDDYNKVSSILINEANGRNTVFMGHGNKVNKTDTYIKLQNVLLKKNIKNVFICAIEEEPFFDSLKVPKENIFLQPFLIAAGRHAEEDMIGENEESLKSILEKKGSVVFYSKKGLGEIYEISELFAEHIKDVIESRK